MRKGSQGMRCEVLHGLERGVEVVRGRRQGAGRVYAQHLEGRGNEEGVIVR